jgi:hypothetical protein
VGRDSAISSPASAVSRRESASATMFVAPDLYSTLKSNPRSLLAHWCYGIVERRWSNKYFKLK